MKLFSHQPRSGRQEVFGFVRRIEHRDRLFRRVIVVVTALAVGAIVLSSGSLRTMVAVASARVRQTVLTGLGLSTSNRPVSDEEWHDRREQKIREAGRALDNFLRLSSPEVREFFEKSGMGSDSALHRWGRGDQVFMFSSSVFENDHEGRSFRLRPKARSVWLRELKMQGGPHGLLLIPDRPELRELATKAGAIVVESSVQTTNSWGLRGPEPDLNARMRILALGDSFMEGMFIGDRETPPLQLESYLANEWKCSVSVLNTGHVGYGPEQYYYTFLEYVDRFRPQFLLLSVCHNDFGDDQEVLSGRGHLYEEAAYWLNKIIEICRGRGVSFLIVPVPHREQVDHIRSNGHYPGRLFNFVTLTPQLAISLVDDFIDENLRLKAEARAKGSGFQSSILYNAEIQDGHFSSLGSVVWARSVSRRISRLISPDRPGLQFFEPAKPPRQ